MKEEGDESSKKKIEEDALQLRQLIGSLDDSTKKLEEFYKKKNPDDLNKTKKFILQINNKILDLLK
jgi:hypothetical protein